MPVIGFTEKIFIALFIMSYLTSMLIQWRNPKIKVDFTDWVFNFLCSSIGAVIAYAWGLEWVNLGPRMGILVFVISISYPVIKFLNSPEAQQDFAEGIGKGLLNFINRIFKGDANNNNNLDK